MSTRSPAVADRFYQGSPERLERQLDTLVSPVENPVHALAVVSPHAGYVYSGKVAGAVFSRTEAASVYVVLGPNHRGFGAPAALMTSGTWRMPWGLVDINEDLARQFLDRSTLLSDDETAHHHEHSLEVQLPFIHRIAPSASIVPLVLSVRDYGACEEIGTALSEAVRAAKETVTIVASTDMSHYEPHQVAMRKDQPAIEAIKALDPFGLYSYVVKNRITMCGVIPTVIALIAAKKLGATTAELIQYSTSGEESGDFSQVVGYAGLLIT